MKVLDASGSMRIEDMCRFILLCSALIELMFLTACRSDFSVMTCKGQKTIFASSTDWFGWRECMFQYDVETSTLFSYQSSVKVGDVEATAIRAYSLRDGLKREWYVFDEIDNEFSPAVILDGKVYFSNLREWEGAVEDNVRVIDLLDGKTIHNSYPLTGLLPASTSCVGMMRIGKSRILLKLLNRKSFIPSIALFDPAAKKVLRKLDLGNGNDGQYVWSSSCNRFCLSVSDDLQWVALCDKKNETLSFYDSFLNANKSIALRELLKLKEIDYCEDWAYERICLRWIGDDIVVLWSMYNGRWCNYDVKSGEVLKSGKLNLRKRAFDPKDIRDCYNKKEYIRCALGRMRFLVKGFEEGLFSKEGYIVDVDPSGEERRQPVKWGTWPSKMLTEEYYYAENLL